MEIYLTSKQKFLWKEVFISICMYWRALNITTLMKHTNTLGYFSLLLTIVTSINNHRPFPSPTEHTVILVYHTNNDTLRFKPVYKLSQLLLACDLTWRVLVLFYQVFMQYEYTYSEKYRNDPKFSDRYAWANSANPDQTAPRGAEEQSDLGLHCLPFRLHRLDSLLYGRAT